MPFWKNSCARLCIALYFITPMATMAQSKDISGPNILFICEHGNVKSLMAATYFNELARERHLPLLGIARGLAPDSDAVPASIVEGLGKQGFEVSSFHPIKVTVGDYVKAQRVIVLGEAPPSMIGSERLEVTTWGDVPAASIDFDGASKAIRRQVESLVRQLSDLQK